MASLSMDDVASALPRQDLTGQNNQLLFTAQDRGLESFAGFSDNITRDLCLKIDGLITSRRGLKARRRVQQSRLEDTQLAIHKAKALLDGPQEHIRVGKIRNLHEDLTKRCTEQLLALEATHSQICEVEEPINTAEKQLSALCSCQETRPTLPDSTIRASDDILKLIFEQTVAGIDNAVPHCRHKVKQTVLLAAVCRRWRAIAIDTPRLWSDIYIDLHRPRELEWHRDTILPRVKNLPSDVTISNIATMTAPALLKASGFTNVRFMERLYLMFSTNYDIEPILRSNILPPTCYLGSLYIHCQPWAKDGPSAVDILGAISGLPSFHELSISYVPRLEFRITFGAPDITRLYLEHTLGIILPEVLAALPNLQFLRMNEGSLKMGDSAVRFTAPSVRSIELINTMVSYHMTHNDFPNLKSLTLCRITNPAFFEFLSRHRSIEALEFGKSNFDVFDLQSVASQVKELAIDARNISILQSTDDGSSIPFPSLESISLYVRGKVDYLEIEQFDPFIRARCLPTRHPKCLAKHPLHRIQNVSFIFTIEDDQKWYESELYKESTRFISFGKVYGWNVLHLSWPEWS